MNQEEGFLGEVDEQPGVLLELAKFYESAPGLALLRKWAALTRRERRVVFCGMGTSEFAPAAVLGTLANLGVDATTHDAGEFLRYPRPIAGLPVLISQSGESIETRRLAERLASDRKLVAVTNNETSALARAAELVLPLLAGEEASISTKTYTNTLAVLHLMARALEDKSAIARGLRALRGAAASMSSVDVVGIRRAAAMLSAADAVAFVSRGPAMAAAKQAALTFMEGVRLPTNAFTGGAFRHGPFELIDRDFACVFMIPRGATTRLLSAMAAEVVDKGGRVVVITDADVRPRNSKCVVLRVPRHGEALFAISAAPTHERLLDAVAVRRGLTTGHFRYGAKITAKE